MEWKMFLGVEKFQRLAPCKADSAQKSYHHFSIALLEFNFLCVKLELKPQKGTFIKDVRINQ